LNAAPRDSETLKDYRPRPFSRSFFSFFNLDFERCFYGVLLKTIRQENASPTPLPRAPRTSHISPSMLNHFLFFSEGGDGSTMLVFYLRLAYDFLFLFFPVFIQSSPLFFPLLLRFILFV